MCIVFVCGGTWCVWCMCGVTCDMWGDVCGMYVWDDMWCVCCMCRVTCVWGVLC